MLEHTAKRKNGERTVVHGEGERGWQKRQSEENERLHCNDQFGNIMSIVVEKELGDGKNNVQWGGGMSRVLSKNRPELQT